MLEALAVAAGGALGALARYGLSGWIYSAFGTGFPYGTLAVNVIGSFAMGLVLVASERGAMPAEVRALLAVGLLGAFTTFSTFSVDTLSLTQQGAWARAALNVVASVVLCLAAATLAVALARRMW